LSGSSTIFGQFERRKSTGADWQQGLPLRTLCKLCCL